jgi:cytochrome c556
MTRTRFLTWAVAATTAAAIAMTATAAGNPVADRQAAMKSVGAGMKDGASLMGAFDAAKAKAAMGAVASNATKAKGLFPAGSGSDPKTEADPKIWQNKADFDKRLTELATLATAAGKATTADAYRPAFQKVGATCKGCHDIYRMKKKS